MNDMFQEIDLDNSGYIGRNEFSKNLKLHMAPEAQKFINDYLTLLDTDQDGQISFRELIRTLYPGGTDKEYDKILKISLPGHIHVRK